MQVKLVDLIPGLTAEDVAADTQGVTHVINADPKSNEAAGQARMFTLDQL